MPFTDGVESLIMATEVPWRMLARNTAAIAGVVEAKTLVKAATALFLEFVIRHLALPGKKSAQTGSDDFDQNVDRIIDQFEGQWRNTLARIGPNNLMILYTIGGEGMVR